MNQGGTADKCFLFVLDREYISVKDVSVFNETPLTEHSVKGVFPFQWRLRYDIFKTMVALPAPDEIEYQNANANERNFILWRYSE